MGACLSKQDARSAEANELQRTYDKLQTHAVNQPNYEVHASGDDARVHVSYAPAPGPLKASVRSTPAGSPQQHLALPQSSRL